MGIKLKKYKIKNVDREICCVEQKIAYNLAFAYREQIKNDLEKCTTEFQKSDVIFQYRSYLMNHFKELYPEMRYNPDALQVALSQGLKNYMESPHFIFREYEEVGKMFPIPYKDHRS